MLTSLTLILLIPPFNSAWGEQKGKGPIKIALIFPFTGVGADHGRPAEDGIRMRLEEAKGKVAGRDIKFIVADENVMDPSVTLNKIKQLVQRDKIDILLGPLFGSSQQAVAPYLAENKVIDMALHNGSWLLKDSGNFFIWPSSDYCMAMPMGEYAFDVLGYRKLSIIAPDYIFGRTLLAGPADVFKKKGERSFRNNGYHWEQRICYPTRLPWTKMLTRF